MVLNTTKDLLKELDNLGVTMSKVLEAMIPPDYDEIARDLFEKICWARMSLLLLNQCYQSTISEAVLVAYDDDGLRKMIPFFDKAIGIRMQARGFEVRLNRLLHTFYRHAANPLSQRELSTRLRLAELESVENSGNIFTVLAPLKDADLSPSAEQCIRELKGMGVSDPTQETRKMVDDIVHSVVGNAQEEHEAITDDLMKHILSRMGIESMFEKGVLDDSNIVRILERAQELAEGILNQTLSLGPKISEEGGDSATSGFVGPDDVFAYPIYWFASTALVILMMVAGSSSWLKYVKVTTGFLHGFATLVRGVSVANTVGGVAGAASKGIETSLKKESGARARALKTDLADREKTILEIEKEISVLTSRKTAISGANFDQANDPDYEVTRNDLLAQRHLDQQDDDYDAQYDQVTIEARDIYVANLNEAIKDNNKRISDIREVIAEEKNKDKTQSVVEQHSQEAAKDLTRDIKYVKNAVRAIERSSSGAKVTSAFLLIFAMGVLHQLGGTSLAWGLFWDHERLGRDIQEASVRFVGESSAYVASHQPEAHFWGVVSRIFDVAEFGADFVLGEVDKSFGGFNPAGLGDKPKLQEARDKSALLRGDDFFSNNPGAIQSLKGSIFLNSPLLNTLAASIPRNNITQGYFPVMFLSDKTQSGESHQVSEVVDASGNVVSAALGEKAQQSVISGETLLNGAYALVKASTMLLIVTKNVGRAKAEALLTYLISTPLALSFVSNLSGSYLVASLSIVVILDTGFQLAKRRITGRNKPKFREEIGEILAGIRNRQVGNLFSLRLSEQELQAHGVPLGELNAWKNSLLKEGTWYGKLGGLAYDAIIGTIFDSAYLLIGSAVVGAMTCKFFVTLPYSKFPNMVMALTREHANPGYLGMSATVVLGLSLTGAFSSSMTVGYRLKYLSSTSGAYGQGVSIMLRDYAAPIVYNLVTNRSVKGSMEIGSSDVVSPFLLRSAEAASSFLTSKAPEPPKKNPLKPPRNVVSRMVPRVKHDALNSQMTIEPVIFSGPLVVGNLGDFMDLNKAEARTGTDFTENGENLRQLVRQTLLGALINRFQFDKLDRLGGISVDTGKLPSTILSNVTVRILKENVSGKFCVFLSPYPNIRNTEALRVLENLEKFLNDSKVFPVQQTWVRDGRNFYSRFSLQFSDYTIIKDGVTFNASQVMLKNISNKTFTST